MAAATGGGTSVSAISRAGTVNPFWPSGLGCERGLVH